MSGIGVWASFDTWATEQLHVPRMGKMTPGTDETLKHKKQYPGYNVQCSGFRNSAPCVRCLSVNIHPTHMHRCTLEQPGNQPTSIRRLTFFYHYFSPFLSFSFRLSQETLTLTHFQWSTRGLDTAREVVTRSTAKSSHLSFPPIDSKPRDWFTFFYSFYFSFSLLLFLLYSSLWEFSSYSSYLESLENRFFSAFLTLDLNQTRLTQ